MELFKTLAFFSDFDQDHSYLVDTIWHEENWWLVATFLVAPATGERLPERLILMDGVFVRYQEVQNRPYRFVLSNSIPKSVLDGIEQGAYVVACYPALADSRELGGTQ